MKRLEEGEWQARDKMKMDGLGIDVAVRVKMETEGLERRTGTRETKWWWWVGLG